MAMASPSEEEKILSQGHILIVDDVQDNINILKRRLTKKGYEIHFATDGASALKRIAEHRPDLLLLDWMMPKMSGIEVLERIREDYSASHLPVIMLTARNETEALFQAFELGANDYIVKPFDFKVVLARVKSQIERLQALRALEVLLEVGGSSTSEQPENDIAKAKLLKDAISARKAAEASMRDALLKAESGARAKQAFLANMCHELRTPLNSVIGFSEVMKDQLEGDHAEYVQLIHKSGEHLLSMLNSMIVMSELEQNHPPLKVAEVNAIALVETVISITQHALRDKNIEVIFVPGEINPILKIDETAITQAFLNILSNAIKFSNPDSKIIIGFDRLNDQQLGIVIKDCGAGLCGKKLSTLCEPFERGDFDYSGQYDGLGLGLPIAKKLVEAHGGFIKIEDRNSQGTKATIVLEAYDFGEAPGVRLQTAG